jgi:dipeptidyl aminopeptidase/acylaminoacyl peptidase
MRTPIAAACALVCTLLVAHRAHGQAPSLEYDSSAPLALETKEIATRDGIRVSSFSFTSPRGGKADGMLVTPIQIEGKTAAIIWMHSGGMDNNLADAMLMAHAGAVSLILNPTGASSMKAEDWRDEMVRSILNIRRAVDVLVAREDVGPKRIAYVGHSYGAMMGAVAVADKRFKAAVFEVGLLGMSIHIRTSPHPWPSSVREELGDKLEEFLKVIEPLDATHYVAKLSPTALLFQSARIDPGVPQKDALNFFQAASEPKQFRWYDTGHDVLDIQAIADRARFLADQLALRPIEPILKEKIGLEN